MYESYFGLSGKPFQLSPDPQFFFESSPHSKAISYLRYGLEVGEGFIVITGPIGTGKTTIARNLIVSLDDSIQAIQIATTCLSPEELVTMVAANFGLQVEGLNKGDILRRLESFLLNLNRQGKRALLIIDEAQNLSSETIEELRMLSNFQIDGKPLIQSFLLGQEELKPIIELPQMEQFRQRIIASCHLRAFDPDETRNYVLHRLNRVGWSSNPSFSEQVFDVIAEHTGGIPRKINMFMDRLFLFGFMESINSFSVEHVQSIIDEMDSELAGGLQKTKPEQFAEKDAVETASLDVDKMYNTLMDVAKILDDDIYRKTLTVKHLDQLIREKRKTLSNAAAGEDNFSD